MKRLLNLVLATVATVSVAAFHSQTVTSSSQPAGYIHLEGTLPTVVMIGSFSSRIVNLLLQDSADRKMEAWRTYEANKRRRSVVILTAKLAALRSSEKLEAVFYG